MARKILIIDDCETEQILLTGILENEYRVLKASNGKEGLDVLGQNCREISLVLLDIIMPEMDGFEFLKYTQTNPLWCKTPIVVLTEMTDEESQIKALKLGANGYITKPFNQELLLETIRNTISLCETAALSNAALVIL